MRFITTWLFVLLFVSCVQAETGFLDRSVKLKGKEYRYQVYVPLEFTKAKKWPVILSLHGNGRQGNDGIQGTGNEMGNAIRANRPAYPAIVVFPQAQTGTRWFDAEMEDLVMAELDRTVDEFSGDPARLYLTGFSMGAIG